MKEHETYTRAIALSGFPDFIRKYRGDPMPLFDAVGIDISTIDTPQAFISWPKCCDLLEISAKTLNQNNLGLLWALELPDDLANTGPSLYLANLMPDVISLIDMILEYQKIHTTGIQYSYVIDKQNGKVTGRVDFHPDTPQCRQFSEHIMAAVSLGVSRFLGPPFDKPLDLGFQHSEPDDLALHDEIFGCPIVFNAKRTEMSYDLKILEKKMSRIGKMIKPLFDLYLNRLQKTLPKTSAPMTAAITSLMPYVLETEKSDIISVSYVLNVSPKKMQRLLKQEGTSYSALKDSIRSKIAKRVLGESDMSISTIANMLGYASTPPFAHACKRWYALSPRALRNSLRNLD